MINKRIHVSFLKKKRKGKKQELERSPTTLTLSFLLNSL